MKNTIFAAIAVSATLAFGGAQAEQSAPSMVAGAPLAIAGHSYNMMGMWTSGVDRVEGQVEQVRHRHRSERRYDRRRDRIERRRDRRIDRRRDRRVERRRHRRLARLDHCHRVFGCHGHRFRRGHHRHSDYNGFAAGAIFGVFLDNILRDNYRY